MKVLAKLLAVGVVFSGLVFPLMAGDTSVQQPAGLEDLTTDDASRAFSMVKPNSADWLSYNSQYYLDYKQAFNNATHYNRSDRSIIRTTAVDFGYSFAEPTVVNAYKIYLPKDDGIYVDARAPARWYFQGSDDKQNWTTLDTRGNVELENGWGARSDAPASRYYAFENSTAYRHYRLNVTAVVNSLEGEGYLQVAELEFFNCNAPSGPVVVEATNFVSRMTYHVTGMDDGVTLERLPVLVRFNPSEMTFGRPDHKDLAFVQDGGTTGLVYEVDTWSNDLAQVWVCLNTARRGTSLTMYWGSSEDYESTCAFSWSDYARVIHFNGTEAESGRYAFTSGKSAFGSAVFGLGAQGNKTRINTPFGRLGNMAKFAASVWLRPSSNGGTARVMSTKAGYTESGFELLYVVGTGMYVRGNKEDKQIAYRGDNGVTFPCNVWTHYAAVVDGSGGGIYKNGLPMATDGSINTPTLSPGIDLMLGGFNGVSTDSPFAGTMDEFRLYNGVPSPERLKAEYQAMADTNFLTEVTASSIVALTSVVAATNALKVTVTGSVQMGDGISSETVVVEVISANGSATNSYVLADRPSGSFSLEITDLTAGVYYVSAELVGEPDSRTMPQLLRLGEVAPLEWTGAAGDGLWATPGNWDDNRVPTRFDSVLFGSHVAADATILVSNTQYAVSLVIRTTTAFTLGATDAESSLLRVGGIVREDVEGTEEDQTLAVPIALDPQPGCDFICSVAGYGALRLNTICTCSSLIGFVKTGSGTLHLMKQNTVPSGSLNVLAGTVKPLCDKAAQGKVTIGGGEESAKFVDDGGYAHDLSPYVYTNGEFRASKDLNSNGADNYNIHEGGYAEVKSIYGGKIDLWGGTMKITYRFWNGCHEQHIAARASDLTARLTGDLTASEYFDYVVKAENGSRPIDLIFNGSLESGDQGHLLNLSGAGTMQTLRGWGIVNNAVAKDLTWLMDNASGAGSGRGSLTVGEGATLRGTGRFGGHNESQRLTVNGTSGKPATLAPGSMTEAGEPVFGTFTVGTAEVTNTVAMGADSKLRLAVGTQETRPYTLVDGLLVNGTVTVAAGSELSVTTDVADLSTVRGGVFDLVRATDGITGDFAVVTPKANWRVVKEMAGDVCVALKLSIPRSGLAILVR